MQPSVQEAVLVVLELGTLVEVPGVTVDAIAKHEFWQLIADMSQPL